MPQKKRKTKPKDSNAYPAGWDYKRAAAIAKHYDDRKDEDLGAAPELPDQKSIPVWIEVPPKLVPQVRKLIQRYKKSA